MEKVYTLQCESQEYNIVYIEKFSEWNIDWSSNGAHSKDIFRTPLWFRELFAEVVMQLLEKIRLKSMITKPDPYILYKQKINLLKSLCLKNYQKKGEHFYFRLYNNIQQYESDEINVLLEYKKVFEKYGFPFEIKKENDKTIVIW